MTFSRLLRSLTSLALAATLAVALVTPAGAQHYTRGGGGYQRGYSSHYGWHGGHPYGGYGYHGYPGAYVGGALLGLGLGALLGGALLAPAALGGLARLGRRAVVDGIGRSAGGRHPRAARVRCLRGLGRAAGKARGQQGCTNEGGALHGAMLRDPITAEARKREDGVSGGHRPDRCRAARRDARTRAGSIDSGPQREAPCPAARYSFVQGAQAATAACEPDR